MNDARSVNSWVGSELGIIKGVNLVCKTATNFFDPENVGKENEIVSICWANEEQTKIYAAYKHGFIREFCYDTSQFGAPLRIPDFQKGSENTVKVCTRDNSIVTCTSKGRISILKPQEKGDTVTESEVNVGPNSYDMALSPDRSRFAAGGKENALKVYDFEKMESIFKAKNVPHDWLQLRVPVWVTGIRFLDDSASKIVTSTGTSKIRLYDVSGEKRRPCIEMNFDEFPLTAISLTHNSNQVIVSNTRGSIGMFDFRKQGLVRVYKGCAGSVRHLERHPTLDYVASCGLDRFLRIHDINTGKLEYKVYLKARLNCVMFSELDFVADAKKAEEEKEEEITRKRKFDGEEQDEDDPVWRRMKTVDEDESSDEESSSLSDEE